MMEYIPLLRICLVVGGILQILCFLRILYKTERSKQWPTTSGEILSSTLLDFGWDGENTNKVYKAAIKYCYQIAGVIYCSKKIYYGDWISIGFSSYMKKIVKEYSIGVKCTVHYNPQKPQESVLKVILAFPAYCILVGGLLFVGIGLYLYY